MTQHCPFSVMQLALALCFFRGLLAFADPVVNIENGPIFGENRGEYYAFEGIPYAKPPIGDRRFAASVLNDETWSEPLNATSLGPYCMQWSHTIAGKDKLFGEEDCLYLNIYTTSLNETNGLSTLFYIHGGAFMFGGGGFFSPEHVLRKSMIMVTFNYRVGPLGFLSTEDDVIPGNFGLKDQVTALQWVKRNVHHFGGDPNRITLAGFSAGGASVHLHYLSPMSRGLFQNGIAHSGTALNPWVMAEDSTRKAHQIAKNIGCPVEQSSQSILSCLRDRAAEDIVRQVPFLLDYLYNPFSPLGVVIEKQSKLNRRPFLVEHPAVLSRKGKLTKVPLILSVTQGEGLYPGAEFISQPGYLQDIDSRWYDLLPSILDYKTAVPDVKKRDELSKAISERYFGKERKLSLDNFRDFVSILSNRLFFAGVTKTAKLLQPHLPVYFYYFNFKAAYGIGELLSESNQNYGVAHGEDVFLVFPSSIREKHPLNKDELRVVSNFVNLYYTFSQGRKPKYGAYVLPLQNITDKLQYMEVKEADCEICGLPKTAYGVSDEQFWDTLDFNDEPPRKMVHHEPHNEL
ncbi:esterase-5B-like [Anopheles funestus]|uniref:esterase-5B-like n=1 Tax=Anopheles funestus TaxID=62324 RepID=UPI0020C7364E|nr:esterase-5B-like [Anopheles funestus]